MLEIYILIIYNLSYKYRGYDVIVEKYGGKQMNKENTMEKNDIQIVDKAEFSEKEGMEQEVILINEEAIRDKIYTIRGQKVMLDTDLAEIYGYDTKNFNRQVKNNSSKFEGDDFMFQLSDEELDKLSRCKNCTLNRGSGRGKNIKYNPYVFTEQGIYMLMTVLRGELAIKQSRALVRTFKNMKDYIIENQGLIGQREFIQLSMQVTDSIRDTTELRIDLIKVEDQMSDVIDRLSNVVTKSELSDIMFSDNMGRKLHAPDKEKYQDMIHELLKNDSLILQ